MKLIVEKLVEILTISPDPILRRENLGAKKPSTRADIPAVAISISIKDHKHIGIGRFVRAGGTIVQHTVIIDVKANSDSFSDDLKSLRIWPLPLIKSPSSTSTKRNFTEQDVQVRNVTDPTAPIIYRVDA